MSVSLPRLCLMILSSAIDNWGLSVFQCAMYSSSLRAHNPVLNLAPIGRWTLRNQPRRAG